MSDRAKKIFLGICILTPFLLYSGYYYSKMIRNAPYRFADFEYITFRYGLEDSLENRYYSRTGEYIFLNRADSLVKTNVKLRKDDLLYLHRKAVNLGFWNFPEEMPAAPDYQHQKSPKYYLEFAYKEKTKRLMFDAAYNQNPKLKDAAKTLISEVDQIIQEAKSR